MGGGRERKLKELTGQQVRGRESKLLLKSGSGLSGET